MPIKKPKISSLVKSQLPEFVREDYQTFIAFLEAYYEFLSENYDIDILSVRDIDNTLEQFIIHFRNEYSKNLPTTLLDERFLLQHVKDYYLAKGTSSAFAVLFAVLFAKNATIEYPSTQMLRASDGKWNQDVSIFAKINAGNPAMVVGRLVDVVTPTKIIKVQVDKTQNVEVEVDRITQIAENIYEFYIDRRFFGNVSIGDRMRYSNTFDATILSTTSKVEIQRPGKHFKVGELYAIKNGKGTGSVLKVSRVDANGGILSLEFVKYGIGYETDFTSTLLPIGGTSATTAGSSSLTISGGSPSYSVGFNETTNGFFEQGIINKSDYNNSGDPAVQPAFDGTYVGDIVREFYVDNKYTVLDADEPAVVRIILGSLTKYPGYYTSNDGFLDDAIFIQDSKYYQAFSYVVKIDERLESYKSIVKTLLHPAGMALFGEYDIRNEFDLSTRLESMIKYLVLTFQDQVGSTDSISAKHFGKSVTDSISESDVYSSLLSKPLGSQTDYDGNTEDTKVTVTSSTPILSFGKLVNSSLLNDGVTYDDNTVTPTEAISSKNMTKLVNSSLLYDNVTTDNNTVTPTESISKREITKLLDSTDTTHYLYDGVTADNDTVTPTHSVPVFATTKYIDTNYLNDGITADDNTVTMTGSGGSLWLNSYTDPYPAGSSYFLNDSGNYTTGESAFTG